jgi:hypothetical protein
VSDSDRICTHENRIHALGGGLFVCFECWCRMLLGLKPVQRPISSTPDGRGRTGTGL